jgi:phosphoribosyl 1,2-cyclic phosphodiesterase
VLDTAAPRSSAQTSVLVTTALVEHRHELKAKRIVLTHLGREMLAEKSAVPELCAHDGLVIEI